MNLRHLRAAAVAGTLFVSACGGHGVAGAPPVVATKGIWLMPSPSEFDPAPPVPDELGALNAIVAKRTAQDVERIRWWNVGGPAYRWNELAMDELLARFVPLLPAVRNLALLHAAIDDAVTVAAQAKHVYKRRAPPSGLAAATGIATEAVSYPSEHAAAAAAAAEVLAYLFPDRASVFAAKADEAMHTRLLAGVEYPSDIAAGRDIGRRIASLAIERGKSDGSSRKWTGNVPEGAGRWKGSDPIGAQAAHWRTWVLPSSDALRPPPPPAHDSDRIQADVAEIRSFRRTPKSNHIATYWEVFGGARAYALWNEIARLKLLEYSRAREPVAASRAFAVLNVALYDASVACFDAKYAYWMIRPSQLDPSLATVVPPPNHPSYPAAHGCVSTAATTVLAELFPRDAERLTALGTEAAEARIWAGIHFRSDIEAGQTLGRRVAEQVLMRAGLSGR